MPHDIRLTPVAFRVALDPTPTQGRAMSSHAGAARFAYNWGIARITEALEARENERAEGHEPTTPVPGHFDLCKQWTEWKNTTEWTDRDTGETTTGVPWVARNFVGTYQAALRDADKAWKDYFNSRTGQRAGRALGRPRFKSKRTARASFQLHGPTLRLASATKIVLPKVGTVTVLSDDSRHPAMTRARRRTGGQRHTGNRRRSRQLWQDFQRAQHHIDHATRILHRATEDADPDRVLARLNARADARARATAVAKATERLQKAKTAAAKATDPARQAKADTRVATAREQLTKAEAITASRKDAWTEHKLAEATRTGHLTPVQAADLADALALTTAETAELTETALQPRITRGTLTLGADGLWWLSLSCEVPREVRTTPTRRQRTNGPVGLDLGTRHTATFSKRTGGNRNLRNPRHLEAAQAELRTAQQHLARCQPGSARHARAKARVGLIHADVARLRDQHLHRASTRLAHRYEAIATEGYNLQDLAREGSKNLPKKLRRQRNRALADSGLGALRTHLAYKTERSGSHLTVTERSAPTGRTCGACGTVKTKPIPQHHELFTCDHCSHTTPRRHNTARVLETVAAAHTGPPNGESDQPRGGEVRPRQAPGPDGHSPTKRAARTQPPGRDQTGTPGP